MPDSQTRFQMEKIVKGANNYSGLLSFISFIGLILFWVFGMQAGITGLAADHATEREAQAKFHEKTLVALTGICDSLKDRSTDHILFDIKMKANTDQLQKNTVSVTKMSEAVVRISFALEGIEKSMNRIRP